MSDKSLWHRSMGKWPFAAVLFTVILGALLAGCGNNSGIEAELAELSSEETQPTEYMYDENMKDSEKVVQSTDSEVCEDIYVYVCGAVENPGVYRLDGESRIFEAVDKAGGLKENAAEDAVNLAGRLNDGDEVRVPTKDEVKVTDFNQNSTVISTAGEDTGTDTGRVNINLASVEELMSVNGIGQTRAEAIVSYREMNGAFGSIEDIKKVSGIKEGLFSKIKDKIRI